MNIQLIRTVIFIVFCHLAIWPSQLTQAAPETTVTRQQVVDYIKTQSLLHPKEKWDLADFDAKIGDKLRYTADEVNEFAPLKRHETPGKTDSAEVSDRQVTKLHFQGVKIRSSYSDVLTIEDPTISTASEKASDLTGALLSYTRDFKARSDAWAAKGALLFPFNFTQDVNYVSTQLKATGIIPSVSFDRETNSADTTKNVDSLIFRVGTYAVVTGVGPFTSLTFRCFGTYGTDFNFQSSTPAAEFELEPAYSDNRFFGIGRRVGLFHVANPDAVPGEPGTASTTLVNYRLRAYLHAAYGRTVNAGNKTGVSEEDFFRIGPNLELKFDKLFTDHFTLKIAFQHFVDVVGNSSNHNLLSIEPEFIFNPNDQTATTFSKPVISLKASYQNGGVDLTEEKVRTLYVGLGVTL